MHHIDASQTFALASQITTTKKKNPMTETNQSIKYLNNNNTKKPHTHTKASSQNVRLVEMTK
jgi:hypothetical protein